MSNYLPKLRIFSIILILCCFSLPGFGGSYTFSNLEGEKISYEEITSSPKTVLFTWTTWCPYCRQELKRLLSKEIFLDDISIYYVNLGETNSTVKRFAKRQKIPLAVQKKIILDTRGFIANKFYITAIPAYIFLKDKKFVRRSLYLNDYILQSIFGD